MHFSSKQPSLQPPSKTFRPDQLSGSNFLATLNSFKSTGETTKKSAAAAPPPSVLSNGLNVPFSRVKRSSVFGNEQCEDDNLDNDQPGSSASVQKKKMPLFAVGNQRLVEQARLEALAEDPTVFDYDAVYDGMKGQAKQNKVQPQQQQLEDNKRPRYMENLLRSAAVRKIDRLRADERKYKRERETEAGEFDDKEAFVTSTYRDALEQARKMEIEENERERLDSLKPKDGLSTFYRNLLNKDAAEHKPLECAIQSASTTVQNDPLNSSNNNDISTEKQNEMVSEHLVADGILFNDSNEVVDKRQLLTTGLNIANRKRPAGITKVTTSTQDKLDHSHDSSRTPERDSNVTRERQKQMTQEMLDQQRVVKQQRLKEEELLASKLLKKNDEASISDAKTRYLSRLAEKKQQLALEKATTDTAEDL